MLDMMPFDNAEILRRVRNSCSIVLCLDFDGTLTPIQSQPEMCWLTPDQLELLSSLAQCPRLKVGIVSGRSLSDVQDRVGVRGIAYAGNHGLELQDGDHTYLEPQAESLRDSLRVLIRDLNVELRPFRGCWLELKGPTASIHFREADERDIPALIGMTQMFLSAWPDFRMRSGKCVLEIRPQIDWNKSHAVRWIMERAFPQQDDSLLIYCGDDETDEDVFRAWPQEIMLHVGPAPSPFANSRLDGPNEVWQLLRLIDTAVHESPAPHDPH